MQHPSIWEKLRAFIHRRTKPQEPKPKPVTIKPPDLLWAVLFFISTALIFGVCWAMKTNSLQWSENLYTTGIVATLSIGLFSWSLNQWLAVEQSKKDMIDAEEARKVRTEQRIEEDREDARLEKVRTREKEDAEKREATKIKEKQEVSPITSKCTTFDHFKVHHFGWVFSDG